MTIALGALALVLSLTLAALLSRWAVAPTGPRRGARPAEDTVQLAELLRPQTTANDVGWCPAEQDERLHAYDASGGRRCWTCRTYTPRGGAA